MAKKIGKYRGCNCPKIFIVRKRVRMKTEQMKIDNKKVVKAARFLLANGFTDAPASVVRLLAECITINCKKKLHMGKVYATAGAETKTKATAYHARVGYYVKNYYDKFAAAIKNNYKISITGYCGVKNFIEKITLIYYFFHM